MRIVIPSTGRADRVKTLSSFPQDLIRDVSLIIPYEEYDAYKKFNPLVELLVCPAKGIRATRQWILDVFGFEKIVMVDDDLTFYRRIDDKRFEIANREHVSNLFSMINAALDYYAHVGLPDKFMSQQTPRGSMIGRRYNDVLAYNPMLFPNPKPTFRTEVNEDHDFHLQLRAAGHKPYIITEYSKTNRNYAQGGCSTWRTPEVELAGHRALEALWPGIVKVVPHKKSLSGFAVRVNWSKLDGDAKGKKPGRSST